MGLNLLSQPAQAINITFSFDANDASLQTISKTIDGVTINLSNINGGSGNFAVVNAGILLNQDYYPSNQNIAYGDQFDISFSQAVQFISYNVIYSGISTGQTGAFALSNPNGAGSTGNNLANVGTFNFSNQFNLNAGQTSTLKAILSAPDNNLSAIQSITVNATAVPWETDALPVIGSTVLFGLGLWAKNKFAKPLLK
jgi:hypothetical protein